MSDRTAREDFARVWLEICRRSLQGIAPEPVQLFDDSAELDEAIERHPAGGGAA
jgi:hypothetical protein